VTQDLRALWCLDPSRACPRAALEQQRALQLEIEREPVDFLSRELPGRLQVARVVLACFIGAEAADLVFVPNATAGISAVLRSLDIETVVDGAHAPGMVPLALGQLGAAYYTGNAHKWLCGAWLCVPAAIEQAVDQPMRSSDSGRPRA
jgi:selenocysteine lyase/cysteine desulfurase